MVSGNLLFQIKLQSKSRSLFQSSNERALDSFPHYILRFVIINDSFLLPFILCDVQSIPLTVSTLLSLTCFSEIPLLGKFYGQPKTKHLMRNLYYRFRGNSSG